MAIFHENHLIIQAVTNDSSINPIHEFTQSITNCNCNILNFKVINLGDSLSFIALVSGNWGGIAKLEACIPAIARKLNIKTMIKRTSPPKNHSGHLAFSIHIVGINKIGIVNSIISYFSKNNIFIEDINTTIYLSKHNTKLVNMTCTINTTKNIHLATFRDQFITFCDSINVDAGIEPLRD